MRWEAQNLQAGLGPSTQDSNRPIGPSEQLPMVGLESSTPTPQFADTVFHEIHAKSALNKVHPASGMPFRWSINPYRGCTHACVYCYARGTHEYLDLNAGLDFDQQIIVKVNIVEALQADLRKGVWDGQTVALGTNTDPYQRAEGRYQLMPGILKELHAVGAPTSVLTKGTLLSRDIPLLASMARDVPLDVGISLAMIDPDLAAIIEPGTPSPAARLKLVEKLASAGATVSIMAMPILPWITDSISAMDKLFSAVASAGAHSIQTTPLFLRSGSREWFLRFIQERYPHLLPGYRQLYEGRIYAPSHVAKNLAAKTRRLASHYGLGIGGVHETSPDDNVTFRTHLSLTPASQQGAGRTPQQPALTQPSLF